MFRSGFWLVLIGTRLPGEVVVDPQHVAVGVGGLEFVQVPGFVFGLGEDCGAGGLPALVEFVDLLTVLEVEPDDGGAGEFSRGRGGEEEAALALRDAGDGVLLAVPVEVEAEGVDVVLDGFGDFADEDLGDCLGKMVGHAHQLTLAWNPVGGVRFPLRIVAGRGKQLCPSARGSVQGSPQAFGTAVFSCGETFFVGLKPTLPKMQQEALRTWLSGGFVVVEGSADLVDVGAVSADGFF